MSLISNAQQIKFDSNDSACCRLKNDLDSNESDLILKSLPIRKRHESGFSGIKAESLDRSWLNLRKPAGQDALKCVETPGERIGMQAERRESMRVYPDKTLPVTLTCRDILITGSLYNISATGMSIEYEATCNLSVGEVVMITLDTGLGDNPWIDSISCTPVYEILTLAHDQNFSGKRMRQCGLVYHELDPTQRNRIDQLLTGIAGQSAPI